MDIRSACEVKGKTRGTCELCFQTQISDYLELLLGVKMTAL
jgi:hypothetical protein